VKTLAKGMREIKRQIKSVQNTKQITKAMEMVAASKLRRAQVAAQSSRPYTEKMKEVIANIAASNGLKHPMLLTREVKKTAYLIITSDRGLAGGYNSNILRKLMITIRTNHHSQDEYAVFVIGRKGRDFFKKRGIAIAEEVVGLNDSPKFSEIKSIANSVVNKFEVGTYDEVFIVYNEFQSAISQLPVIKKLLPLEPVESSTNSSSYEYEPSPEGVLKELLPRYAETLIYSSVLESKASEFGARMTAMGSATKNATKMISKLTLVYNRARQATITQEISEIVAGANAQS
jgi:F-type H+-transporting ATPase subunit gamma